MTDREITIAEAMNEAIRDEMRRDPGVFMIGEDIARSGGLFKVSEGLLEEFGAERVIDSPISEAAITGVGVGAALIGCRPIVELQHFDFVTLAMDQIVNHAAKWRYMSGGAVTVPLVIRGPIANGIGLAAQHSQALQAWFVHTPGLVVIMPSNAYDAKGLLTSAIRDDNPVLILEKRTLYSRKGFVPEESYLVPIGVAQVVRDGADVTIVGIGNGVNIALQSARQLAKEGIDAEVIDPRTIKPLDVDTIRGSILKTGRLIVVDEGPRTGGVASEIVARMSEMLHDALVAAPIRVAAEDSPIPYAAQLEQIVLPNASDVSEAARRMFNVPQP